MLIPVTLSSKDANPKLPSGLIKISHDEFVLIELQGVLEVEQNEQSERNGKLVGRLKIDEATNKPSLVIGHHLLEGKIAALPKPYAILVRSGPARGSSSTSTSNQTLSSSRFVSADHGGGSDNRYQNLRAHSRRRKARGRGRTRTEAEDNLSEDEGKDEDEDEEMGSIDTGDGDEDEQQQQEKMHIDDPEFSSPGTGAAGVGWSIKGVVKKKIIFSTRPMPVIGKKP